MRSYPTQTSQESRDVLVWDTLVVRGDGFTGIVVRGVRVCIVPISDAPLACVLRGEEDID